MSEAIERKHIYHAETSVLKGHLKLPISQEIEPQTHSKIAEEGGYFSQHTEGYRLESVISFRSSYTHVAGNRSLKPGEGWHTLTTTVIEGLNVLEVLTADRIVGQIITEHPLVGYVPSISFLGTRFENLRIAGHPVELEFDHSMLGFKPDGDLPYSRDPGLRSRVAGQYGRVLNHPFLPAVLFERYNRLSSTLSTSEAVECSLVNQADGHFPGHSSGHVITIPGFGAISLARVTVTHEDPHEQTGVPKKTTVSLTMLDLKLGCVVEGDVAIGSGSTNGSSQP